MSIGLTDGLWVYSAGGTQLAGHNGFGLQRDSDLHSQVVQQCPHKESNFREIDPAISSHGDSTL